MASEEVIPLTGAAKSKAEKDAATVFVRNLPFDLTHEQLEELFEEAGPVKEGFVVFDNQGKSRGFGFVQFAVASDAEAAIKQFHMKKVVKGRKIKVELAKRKQRKQPAPSASSEPQFGVESEPGDDNDQSSEEAGDEQEEEEEENEKTQSQVKPQQQRPVASPARPLKRRTPPSRVVLVKGLKHSTEKRHLLKRLKKVAPVTTVVMKAPESTEEHQAARASFSTLKESAKCIRRFHDHVIQGAKVTVEYLSERAASVICRNLPFKCTEEDVSKFFSQYGEVKKVHLPTGDNKKLRGFGFIDFVNFPSAALAVEKATGQRVKGRPVAVDWALSRMQYRSLVASASTQEEAQGATDSGDDDDDDEEKSESGSEEEAEEESNNAQEDADEDEEEDEDEDQEQEDAKDDSAADKARGKHERDASSSDVHKGTTIFIRNLAYSTTDEQLRQKFSEFGAVKVAKVVIDKQFQRPKGCGFVQFYSKRSVDAVLSLSATASASTGAPSNLTLPSLGGISLGGRVLNIALALDRSNANKIAKERQAKRQKEDKRNLYLADEGVILPDSEAAESLTKQEKERRLAAWKEKKAKLKNPNFSVSRVRLSVRNLPLGMEERALKQLFLKAAAGAGTPLSAKAIRQVKIIRDAERVDANGLGRSKRFGFVEFIEHEHALNALRKTNNNPKLLPGKQRLMVEFALDDHRKLQAVFKKQQQRLLRNRERAANASTDDKKAKKAKGRKCYNCHGSGHMARDCPNPRVRGKKNAGSTAVDSGSQPQQSAKGQKRDPTSVRNTATAKGHSKRQKVKTTGPKPPRAAAPMYEKRQKKRKAGQPAAASGDVDASHMLDKLAQLPAGGGGGGAKYEKSKHRKRRKAREENQSFDTLVSQYKQKYFGGKAATSSRWFD